MFFVSHTSSPSEFFSTQDFNPETLKNDVILCESSSSLSSRPDCRDLSLEHFCESPLQEVSSGDGDLVDPSSQTLPDLEDKDDCLVEEAEDRDVLFSQPLEDQVSSEHHSSDSLNVVTDCCNKLIDQNIEENLETLGADSTTVDEHPLLRNNVIVLQCSSQVTNDPFVPSAVSINKSINDEDTSNNSNLDFDKNLTVVSLNDNPVCMKVLCLESELPFSDESSNTSIRSSDSKVASSVEKTEQVAVSDGITLKHPDVGIFSVIPINSIVLGNITVLPQSKPLNFQVIKQDGMVKSINVKPLIVTDVTWDTLPKTEKNNDSKHCCVEEEEDSKPVTAVVLSDSEKLYKCELCNTTFNRLGNYTRHKKIHTVPTKEDPRFHCEICDKKFIQRCDLTRHMHVHSGTEPHRCTACGKGYLRHSDLLTHQRFHNREKPFICPQCTKGFSQKGDLNRHLRSIHLHLKPLTCAHCHKKFAKEATLIRHVQVAH